MIMNQFPQTDERQETLIKPDPSSNPTPPSQGDSSPPLPLPGSLQVKINHPNGTLIHFLRLVLRFGQVLTEHSILVLFSFFLP